jgi:hypothetical protein
LTRFAKARAIPSGMSSSTSPARTRWMFAALSRGPESEFQL